MSGHNDLSIVVKDEHCYITIDGVIYITDREQLKTMLKYYITTSQIETLESYLMKKGR